MRQCRHCGIEKNISEYYLPTVRVCKSCKSKQNLKYQQARKEKYNKYMREYKSMHKIGKAIPNFYRLDTARKYDAVKLKSPKFDPKVYDDTKKIAKPVILKDTKNTNELPILLKGAI